MRTPTTRWNRVARMQEAIEALNDGAPVEEPGFGFVAASVSSPWPIRLLVGTPAILVTDAAILLLWGAGTFPRVWIGLTILLAWHAAWSWFRMRRTCIVNVIDRRVTVLEVSSVMYRPIGVVFDEVRPDPHTGTP